MERDPEMVKRAEAALNAWSQAPFGEDDRFGAQMMVDFHLAEMARASGTTPAKIDHAGGFLAEKARRNAAS